MLPASNSRFNVLVLVGFVVCVLAFWTLSNTVAFRILGAVTIFQALYVLITRSVPVGIRGRPASFYLTGTAAILFDITLNEEMGSEQISEEMTTSGNISEMP